MEHIEIGRRALEGAGGLAALIESKAPAQLVGFSVDGGVFHLIFNTSPARPSKSAKE
jgi:hypothetical protein